MWSHLNKRWHFPFSPVCFCAAERTLSCPGWVFWFQIWNDTERFKCGILHKQALLWLSLGMRAKLQEFRLPSGTVIKPEPFSAQHWFWFTGPKHSWLSSKVVWWCCSFQVISIIFSNLNLLRPEKIKSQIHIMRGLCWLVDKAQSVQQERSTVLCTK